MLSSVGGGCSAVWYEHFCHAHWSGSSDRISRFTFVHFLALLDRRSSLPPSCLLLMCFFACLKYTLHCSEVFSMPAVASSADTAAHFSSPFASLLIARSALWKPRCSPPSHSGPGRSSPS